MKSLRELTVPAYLLLCIILGGSAQSIWGKLILQLLAIAILAWAALETRPEIERAGRTLILFGALLLLMFFFQLIPMPPALWSKLPGRDVIIEGYRTLGQTLPWLPLSATPYDTLATILSLLPPFAVVAAVLRLRAYKEEWCAAAIVMGTLAAVLLGYLQVTTGKFGNDKWYLYPETNVGSAVGFFANRNHMGTLLLIAVAFIPPLFFFRSERSTSAVPRIVVGICALLVVMVGIAMNGSLAAVLLAAPVLAASACSLPFLGRVRSLLTSAAAIGLLVATIFLAASPVQPKVTGETVVSIEGRQEMWKQTAIIIRHTFPVGTGFGSFKKVYASAEPIATVDPTYVIHAHNDYLELALEGGIFGILLAAAFVLWWFTRAWKIFSARPPSPFASAAIIGSGTILAHSVVDYPLRTSAIAAVFAFCIAIMPRSSPSLRDTATAGTHDRPARHINIQ